ncbi:hypothetical protein LTS07_001835 [Exophiala sideris]|uniref:Uncharacterized protein n=1 Tax=Exophiala sideris TaxID=1016849 RepID=A0ABR0JPX3_9EURO|nr:hypothetical protein LTS07_001835 [Exophiala sideris]KAK5044349.1 hypothetical protein LTR13_000705 [Exophiala sideris]KAK5067849.1 hypothetical protein LTR69_001838 [Exophiala sideris]
MLNRLRRYRFRPKLRTAEATETNSQLNAERCPPESFPYPQNIEFYALKLYTQLDDKKDEIRLVRVLPGDVGDPVHCELVQNISLASIQHDRPELTDHMRYKAFKKELARSMGMHHDWTKMSLEELNDEDCFQQGYSGLMECEMQGRGLAGEQDNSQTPMGDEYYALSYAAGDLQNVEPITLDGMVLNVYSSIAEALRRLRLKSTTLQIWIEHSIMADGSPALLAKNPKRGSDGYPCSNPLGAAVPRPSLLRYRFLENQPPMMADHRSSYASAVPNHIRAHLGISRAR